MKKILFLLGCLIGHDLQAQTIQFLGTPTTQIYVRGQLRVDSIVYLPLRDTTFTPSQIGALVVKSSNSGLYLWNGLKWNTVPVGSTAWGTITGTIGSQTDLISLLNGYQPVLTAGYGIKLVSNTLSWDSTNVRKVDTVYRTNDSTISYTINGHTYAVLIRGTAAGGINSLIFNVPNALYSSPVVFSNTGGAWTGTEVLNSQSSNTVWAGPTTGSPAQPAFRAMVLADLPTGIPNSNLANSSISLALTNAGTVPSWGASSVNLGGSAVLNVPYASSTNSGFLSNTDWVNFNAGANPPVTSVNAQLGAVVVGNGDSVKKYPIDTTNNRQGYVLTFDSTNHKWILAAGTGGSGTVSSVALTVPSFLSVSGSPVTGAGTLAVTAVNQSANTVYAGPVSGGSAAPGFRSIVNADFPVSGVTGGTYNSVTVNAQGIVTAGSVTGSGITSLNGLTGGTQTFATGTAGSDFNISSVGTTHTFNIPDGSASTRGLINTTDWSSFNSRLSQIYGKNGAVIAGTDTVTVPPTTMLGTIFSGSNFTTIAPFVDSGATVSASGGNLIFSGGSNNWQQSLDWPNPDMTEHHTNIIGQIVGTVTSSTVGVGPGMRSVNNYAGIGIGAILDVSSGAHAGQLGIFTLGGSGSANLVYSASTLAFTAGDSIVTTFRRDGVTFYASAYNVTQKTAPLTLSYTFNVASQTNVLPNVSRWAIFSQGGSQSVYSWNISSQETINAPLAIISDSRAYYQPLFNSDRWPFKLDGVFSPTINMSGPSDRLTDALKYMPQVLSLKPRNALLMFSTNEINNGQTVPQIMANYRTYYNTLSAAGINTIILLPFYQGTAAKATVKTLVDSLIAQFPNSYIDTYNPIKQNPNYNLVSDSVHLSTGGDSTVYTTIIQSGKLSSYYHTAPLVNTQQFILNQNSSVQTANAFISGSVSAAQFTGSSSNPTLSSAGVGAGFMGTHLLRATAASANLYEIFLNPSYDDNGFSNVTHGGIFNAGTLVNNGAATLGAGVAVTGASTFSTTGVFGGAVSANRYLTNGSVSASGGQASWMVGSPTLISTLNGDFLINGFFSATFNDNSHSGVSHADLYVNGPAYHLTRSIFGGGTDNGSTILQVTGNAAFTSQVKLGASTTSLSSLNIPTGTAPTSPAHGDMWTDASHLYARLSGITYQLDQQTGSGVTTVGSFSGSSQTNGASIATNTITFGPADGTNPGMVSTGAQSLAGAKTLLGDLLLNHIVGVRGTGTITAGAGAGTGASVSIVGNDIAGDIMVTTGTLPTAGAVIVTSNYLTAFPANSFPIIYPANAATALLSGATMVYSAGTTTAMTINAGTSALTPATIYLWHYIVVGN